MLLRTINVASDFSRTPGGRYREDSDNSGQRFREDVLVPALNHEPKFDRVVIELDGVFGYPSSFLEEAFGGLIREEGFRSADLIQKIEFKAKSPRFNTDAYRARQYILDADRVR